ncbi:MAG: MBL fold metallo-hydrolase [Lactovum sp.]
MRLTALGVWGGYPTKNEGTSAYLLSAKSGYQLLLDCGSRAVTELEKEILPTKLDAVILSHYHEDHIADLGVLRQYRQLYPRGKNNWEGQILKIYGPRENDYEFSKLTLESVSEGYAYDTESKNSIGPFDINFIKTVHPVNCYAMRILERETGQILVYTGDTGYFPELLDFSKDADLLLADVYFLKDKKNMPNHLSTLEAGQIAKKSRIKNLILTHLSQTVDLKLLKKEAQQEAGNNVIVQLAEAHKSWDLDV